MRSGRVLSVLVSFGVLFTSLPQLAAQVAFDRSDFNTGAAPVSVIASDFNQDGNLDLAVVNSASNTVSIFLGNGDGTFAFAGDAAAGSNPSAVAAGDFNWDGVPDLAVSNAGDNTVSILLGNGDGTFTSAGATPFGGNSLVVKDFNRDGTDDLATVSGNTIYVALGNGDGTFGPASPYNGGPFSNSDSITSGDFNGDGIPDLAVENCCDPEVYAAPVGRLAVLLGNGDGTFAAPTFLGTTGPVALAAADLDGDGLADLVHSYAGCHTPCVGVSTFLGNGDGSFRNGLKVPFDQYAHDSGTGAFVFADMDSNGKLDIATLLPGADGVAIFLQKNDGSAFSQDIDFKVGHWPSSIAMGDFNNDGRPDLAITDRGSNSVTILIYADHPGVFLSISGFPLQYPLFFGNQQVGTTSNPQTVTLTNTGNVTLNISNVTVDGDYSQTNDCGSSVEPGASCTFTIQFSPTAAGERDGSITIFDDAPDNQQVIQLRGTGTS